MITRMPFVMSFLVLTQFGFCFSTLNAAETGQLVGQLADVNGQITYVGEVVVFLCDAKTGYPIHRETKKPADFSLSEKLVDQLWYKVTAENGSFEFQDVPVGQYRLVAQSWSGTKGLPKLTGTTSSMTMLHGVAENVTVKQGERTVAFPRQLGNGFLRITNDPQEGNAFLLISLKPTMGDAILGPYGWGNEFVSQLIGVTHMHQPQVTIFGLPDKHSVHVALMNYDNNPGTGAGTYPAGQHQGRLRIVATWSNGHKQPPPELRELTDHLASKELKFNELFGPTENAKNIIEERQKMIRLVQGEPLRMVEVPGLGKRRLIDIAAALAYVELRKSVKK